MILLFSCVPASAQEDIWSSESLLERGYIFDGVGYGLPSGVYDPYIHGFPSLLLASEPNYPNFKPNKIPWSDAPQYIQDIITMSLEGVNSSGDIANYKMPFVLIRVAGSSAIVYVGYNIGLGYDTVTDRMRVCVSYNFYNNCVCYSATFRLSDYSASSDWQKLSASVWGDASKSKVMSFTSTLAYPTSSYDFYFYGGNGVTASDYTSFSVDLYDTGTSASECYFVVDNSIGFQSGRFFYRDTVSTTVYCQYFTPELFSDLDASWIQDYKDSEDFLLSGYDINNFDDDFKVTLDDNSTSFIFNLLTTTVFSNSFVSIAFLSILCLGIVALLFNR